MANPHEHDAPNAVDTADAAFAEIPYTPAESALSRRTPSRWRRVVVLSLVGLVTVGTAVAYSLRPDSRVDPNAPRVVLEVSGMHCPMQCGLRATSALESLPWVVPGSVTANPGTGVVTFAVTSPDAVNEAEIRRVIERAGFGVRSVRSVARTSGGGTPGDELDQ